MVDVPNINMVRRYEWTLDSCLLSNLHCCMHLLLFGCCCGRGLGIAADDCGRGHDHGLQFSQCDCGTDSVSELLVLNAAVPLLLASFYFSLFAFAFCFCFCNGVTGEN